MTNGMESDDAAAALAGMPIGGDDDSWTVNLLRSLDSADSYVKGKPTEMMKIVVSALRKVDSDRTRELSMWIEANPGRIDAAFAPGGYTFTGDRLCIAMMNMAMLMRRVMFPSPYPLDFLMERAADLPASSPALDSPLWRIPAELVALSA